MYLHKAPIIPNYPKDIYVPLYSVSDTLRISTFYIMLKYIADAFWILFLSHDWTLYHICMYRPRAYWWKMSDSKGERAFKCWQYFCLIYIIHIGCCHRISLQPSKRRTKIIKVTNLPFLLYILPNIALTNGGSVPFRSELKSNWHRGNWVVSDRIMLKYYTNGNICLQVPQASEYCL